jgi:hypothetical protein
MWLVTAVISGLQLMVRLPNCNLYLPNQFGRTLMGLSKAILILFLFGSGFLGFKPRIPLSVPSQVSDARWNDPGRCGTNALFILLNTVREFPYASIAKEISVSSQGSSLAELADASRRMGVDVDCLSVPKNQLKSIVTPFLMHIDLIEQGGIGHYITVIQMVEDGDAIILRYVDGGDGKIKILELDKLKGSYSGFLLVLTEKSGFVQKSVILIISFGLGILLATCAISTFAK